jgi:CRP/FNR family transcriptional regulator, cyclic AMP receptor protein
MTRHQKSLADLLARTSWYQDMPPDVQDRVLADVREQHFRQGEVVAARGAAADQWIGVAEGLLKASTIFRTGKVVMFMPIPEGSWVGEGSVLKGELRRYDVVSMRASRVVMIPGTTVRWLADTSHQFCHMMMKRLNERLGQYIGMVEIDRLSDAAARVARVLATLYNPTLHPGMSPVVSLSQAELGELIGLSRQSINAALKRLDAEGLIRAEYGGVAICDLGALQAYQERD